MLKILVRVPTDRQERHFYVLPAPGSVGTDELAAVDDGGARHPTWTLSSVGLEGISAAAGV